MFASGQSLPDAWTVIVSNVLQTDFVSDHIVTRRPSFISVIRPRVRLPKLRLQDCLTEYHTETAVRRRLLN
ncbi:hypothetical protein TNCV_2462621 [Trichonephila clavipes]|nr:hypothetical protein TNCV_2462621 [Trichonephila clavipes]